MKEIREVVYEKTDQYERSVVVTFEHNSYHIEVFYKYKYPDGSFHITSDSFVLWNEEEIFALFDAILATHTPRLTTKKNELALKISELLQKHLNYGKKDGKSNKNC